MPVELFDQGFQYFSFDKKLLFTGFTLSKSSSVVTEYTKAT